MRRATPEVQYCESSSSALVRLASPAHEGTCACRQLISDHSLIRLLSASFVKFELHCPHSTVHRVRIYGYEYMYLYYNCTSTKFKWHLLRINTSAMLSIEGTAAGAHSSFAHSLCAHTVKVLKTGFVLSVLSNLKTPER